MMGSQQQHTTYPEGSYSSETYNTRDFPAQAPTNYTDQSSHVRGDVHNASSQRQDLSNLPYNHGHQPPGGQSSYTERQHESAGAEHTRELPVREKPRVNPNVGSKPSQRICMSCSQPLTGQFVRAIGGTFHLECFRCRVLLILPHNLLSSG